MAIDKKKYSSGSPWEPIVGYSRAVRTGNIIEVSGTTALKNGNVVHPNDAYAQTKVILSLIQQAIEALGGKMDDVVRTRIYVTDIAQWEQIGKAHGEYFSEILPATSMVEVKALIHPDMLVEMEATAVVTQ